MSLIKIKKKKEYVKNMILRNNQVSKENNFNQKYIFKFPYYAGE